MRSTCKRFVGALRPRSRALATRLVPAGSCSSSLLCLRSASGDSRIKWLAGGVREHLPPHPNLETILKAVWKNDRITAQCPNLNIRLTSLRGQVSSHLWHEQGGDPKDIQILAVGTTAIPQHLTGYKKFLSNFYQKTHALSAEERQSPEFPIGYDLLSQGSEAARRAVLSMFNEHYGFSDPVLEQVTLNSAICCGGMRGLEDIAHALVLEAKDSGTFHRFIQPDNSFGTWWNIVEDPVTDLDRDRRSVHRIGTSRRNKLHLCADDVRTFYDKNEPHSNESWYLTPVGNPSGTKATGEQLYTTLESILERSPHATIILDTVYLRTLLPEHARALVKNVVGDGKMMKRIVWLESFSKSHGLCRERLGLYFSANADLFIKLHSANICFSAGPGAMKDHQMMALGSMSAEDRRAVASLHAFWRDERKGLLAYLTQPEFDHLFEEQPHITPEDMEDPCTLYILLKTKPGVNAQQVFVATGALGVDTQMSSGHYVRFSVGALTEPTYSSKA